MSVLIQLLSVWSCLKTASLPKGLMRHNKVWVMLRIIIGPLNNSLWSLCVKTASLIVEVKSFRHQCHYCETPQGHMAGCHAESILVAPSRLNS